MPISLGILSVDECVTYEENLAPLRRVFGVRDFRDWKGYDHAALVEKCRSVEILLTGWGTPNLPPELADDPGRLRYICHLRGGIRRVPKALMERGVIVTNWGDDIQSVAEGAMALLLCMLRQLPTLDAHAKGGPDERIYQMYEPRLSSLTVGLYGYGPIGRHMARMLEPFGPTIAIYDPYAKDVPDRYRRCQSLRELFSACQIISIHCGLNDTTRLSVTRELLELLPQGGIVINTARGWVVDEQALGDLVSQGRLLAGIDTIHDEGNWPGSPLAKSRNAVLSLHCIWGGKGYPPDKRPKEPIPPYVLHNLRAYCEGRPLKHVVAVEDYDLKT